MSVANGRMLGPYQVLSLIGAGGMGEVYRALDTRLNRPVAIKVLPSGFIHDEKVQARFEREARAISSLSHPNICSLFDIGHDGDDAYLVMELLDGESLAQRIARGPLPVSQVARYGAQIADALQHAHRAGITHRDLKPGNIMITGAGAKLLDFGLAKFIEAEPRLFSEDSAPQTAVQPLTAAGTVVGTFQYLSPEQLEGKTVDHRADIFALGVVLYEMATARRPFNGETRTGLIAAILSTDPIPVRSLQPAVPAALERIILTALEKKPEDRWQTAHDVGRQLQWLSESSSGATEVLTPRRRALPIMLTTLGVAIAASLLTWLALRGPTDEIARRPQHHLQISVPADREPVRAGESNSFAISPDGTWLCYLGGSPRALYLRNLDSFEITRVEGSERANGPFWSSDGKWIGFSAGGKLWKVRNAKGSAPEAICDVAISGATASWVGNTILFADAPDGRNSIFRVPAAGGTPVPAIIKTAKEWRNTWPHILPDGNRFLYLSLSSDSIDREVILAELDSPRRSVLAKNVSQVRVVGDQLVYVRDGKLVSQKFDVDKGITTDEPVLLADHVFYFYATAGAEFAVSATGVVVYQTDTRTARLSLTTREGVETKVLDQDGGLFDLALSRDGRKAAATIMREGTLMGDIWIYDLVRGVRDSFTSEPGMEVAPVWSPDGRSIVYSQTQGGSVPFVVQRPISATVFEPLTERGSFRTAKSFSSDGQTLFILTRNPVTGSDILRLSMKSRKLEPFISTNASEIEAEVSPDGRWLAFVSNATGVAEVYLQNLEISDSPRIRISQNGGRLARWRGDTHELFYLSLDGRIVSVVPGIGGRWDDATPTVLFSRPNIASFAAAPDGKSFLLLERADGRDDSLFHVIVGLK